jgi:hypothetical protein
MQTAQEGRFMFGRLFASRAPTERQLREKAGLVVGEVTSAIRCANLAESVIQDYASFCERSVAQQAGMKRRAMEDDDRRRIDFEFICFACFFSCGAITQHIETVWSSRDPLEPLEPRAVFRDMLGAELVRYGDRSGWTATREMITWIDPDSMDTKIEARQGRPLNPVQRLEYYWLFRNDPEKVFEKFGNKMAQALDPTQYLLLSIYAMESALIPACMELGEGAVKVAFR